jgi:hypothetical protein
MNWIGQKISSFKTGLGRKVGHALNTIGSKLNHPIIGHLMNNLDDMQNQYRVDGREEDNQYRGAGFIKRVLQVPASVGSLFQSVGTSLLRNFPE